MSSIRRDIKKLDRKTGRRNTVKKGVPHTREGQNGDISLRITPTGHELFAKINGLWFGVPLSRIQGAVKDTLTGKVIREVGNKVDNIPSLTSGINTFTPAITFTKGRRTISDIVNNVVTKNRTTNDVLLKNGKAGVSSPNIKLLNETIGGLEGASNVASLQFIKSPKSGLTVMGDDDIIGRIVFAGDDSNTTDGSVAYSLITSTATDVTDGDIDSKITFSTYLNNTAKTVDIEGGNIVVGGNIIKASDGGSTITMDTSDNVTIAGDLTVEGDDIVIGGSDDATDKSILFRSDSCPTIIGVDDDQERFVIHSNASFEADCDFELAANGKASFAGVLTLLSGVSSGAHATKVWKDGHLGNQEYIAIPPSDFSLAHVAGTSRSPTFSTSNIGSQDDGASAQGGGVSEFMYATKIIPNGFKAVGAQLWGVAITWSAFSGSLNAASTTERLNSSSTSYALSAAAAGVSFTPFDSSYALEGDGLSYIVIKADVTAATNNIYGAAIDLERIPA